MIAFAGLGIYMGTEIGIASDSYTPAFYVSFVHFFSSMEWMQNAQLIQHKVSSRDRTCFVCSCDVSVRIEAEYEITHVLYNARRHHAGSQFSHFDIDLTITTDP